MKKALSILLAVLAVFQCFCPVSIASFDGTVVKNVAELKAAVAEADENAVIYCAGGTYRFDDTWSIEGVKKNITVDAVDGETVIFTTASPITGWESCTVNGVNALRVSAGGKRISALFADGVSLQSARLPETGFGVVDKPDLTDTVGEDDWMGVNGIYVKGLDYDFESPEDIAVNIPHWWVNDLAPMVSCDASTGFIKMGKYTGMSVQTGDRYFLENVKEALDKPGEWCFDSSEDRVYYVPQSGETAQNLNLFASAQAELLRIEDCDGITFKNIRFADTGWEYGNETNLNTDIHIRNRTWEAASFQGGTEACGAVTVTCSEQINFENCEFTNIGCTAVKYFTGAKHCMVQNCLFNGIGACALYIGGRFLFDTAKVNNPADYAEDITVTNCEICNYGQRFFGACGITLTYCDTAELSHNEIHDGYYTGISVGYTWLFFDNPTQNIAVKDNLIYDIGHHMISDLGGIYMLGVQEGTVVSGNVIHDITCYDGAEGYAGNGIYLDSGCEFMTIENNLVFNCDTSCFNTTLSRNNIIRNNIFAFPGQSAACLGVSQYASAFTDLNSAFINNIFLTDGKVPALEYLQNAAHFSGTGNILWDNTNGDDLYFCEGHRNGGSILRQTAANKGLLGAAVCCDPGFTNAATYDFTFQENSYAVAHGFMPFDYTAAGTLKNTLIGFDTAGGQTPYNADVKAVESEQTTLKFGEKFKAFFYQIKAWFRGVLLKIKGVTKEATGTDFYTAYFEKRGNNKNTVALEKLFNEVKTHNPTYRVDESRKPFADDDRIQAIYFEGEECNGKPTEIFAYYGIPSAAASHPVAAMVLVHGGGLYAQADWVQYWVDRGYAALAIDGFGEEPLEGEYHSDNAYWVANPDSHMPYNGFEDSDKPVNEQWFYYYLTDIILANNILRNDSRIITNQIGVAGISWGGLATSAVMGYDERFAFAIPIYGCPYTYDSTAIYGSGFMSEKTATIWEPSLRLDDVKMPVLMVNGNDDPFFALDCHTTAAAYLDNGDVTFIDGINHGEFRLEETVRFANEQTGKGYGNIHITGLDRNGRNITVTFNLPGDAKNAKVVLYTKKTGFEYEGLKLKEDWKATSVTAVGNTATVTLPSDTQYYYIGVEGNVGRVFNRNTITASTGVFCTAQ